MTLEGMKESAEARARQIAEEKKREAAERSAEIRRQLREAYGLPEKRQVKSQAPLADDDMEQPADLFSCLTCGMNKVAQVKAQQLFCKVAEAVSEWTQQTLTWIDESDKGRYTELEQREMQEQAREPNDFIRSASFFRGGRI